MFKLILSIFVLFHFPVASTSHSFNVTSHTTQSYVYFSPHGGAQSAIVSAIGQANKTIHVQAYSFTSRPIADALIEARWRGVQVAIILDKGQRGGLGQTVNATGLGVWYDSAHAIAHNKVMILDNRTVITGSFNFTKAAEEKNAENLLILESPALARVYLDNWNRHREHSKTYREDN